ncbi:MAG TPA: prephenate dehydrogenase/arogenate dehydrogenase family protein [Anaerolineales bacterium]|nr:prephenate dehydrogenase/arogenate dehydrogenase family protein [Anaerolineales bacterium]
MTVKVVIIGLGQVGASIGLALANHKDQVTTIGYDASGEVNHKAQKMGAVERIGHGLYDSVGQADMVILALPLDQVHETLQSMAQDVREEAVVLDTAPVKTAVAGWVEQSLPPKRHYVGLTLALNPLLLDESGTGIDAARPDLFQNGLAAITAPHGTAGEALKLAASFVTLLGARPFFADPAEIDGIMATVHTLPALAAAALTETVVRQPGWDDIRKMAGHPFMSAMRQLEAEKALAEVAQANRGNTLRVLDEYISTLQSLREAIAGETAPSLQERLSANLKELVRWQRARLNNDWKSSALPKPEIPTFNDLLRQQVGLGRLFGKRFKKPEDE